jgi:hypothetical protein
MTHDLLAHLPASEQLTPMMSSAAGVFLDASELLPYIWMHSMMVR